MASLMRFPKTTNTKREDLLPDACPVARETKPEKGGPALGKREGASLTEDEGQDHV